MKTLPWVITLIYQKYRGVASPINEQPLVIKLIASKRGRPTAATPCEETHVFQRPYWQIIVKIYMF